MRAVSIRRKSCRIPLPTMSGMMPASSTPVGPPPTITNVSSASCSGPDAAFSASSKASRKRRRISRASCTLLRPGAACSHSSCPK